MELSNRTLLLARPFTAETLLQAVERAMTAPPPGDGTSR
jgi:hypothetical protein